MSTILQNRQNNCSRPSEFQQNGTFDTMTEVISEGTYKSNGAGIEEDKTSYVKEIFQHIVEKNSHDRVLQKLEVIFAGNGRFVGELVIQPEHTNVYGSLHGGFTATLIDICTSIAMSTHPQKGNGVSVDLNVSYLKPGPLNERIVITANTLKVGRTLGFSEAVITSKATGDIIAKGSHTKFVGNSDKYELKQ